MQAAFIVFGSTLWINAPNTIGTVAPSNSNPFGTTINSPLPIAHNSHFNSCVVIHFFQDGAILVNSVNCDIAIF